MKRVLVAPLDWGLGHATRCIPIVRMFQQQGCDVVLAGSGPSLGLISEAFPSLKAIALPGYDPVYPRSGSMAMSMARQVPKFIRTIKEEHRAVEKIVAEEKIDLVVSDNRFGAYAASTPSVFITHQSNVLMPKRFGWLAPVVRKMTERFINRFTSCWIPDFPEPSGMAGTLVEFGKLNVTVPVGYIGSLSRFTFSGSTEKRYDVVAIFSGPEPQRSMLEEIVAKQLCASSLRYLIIRGLPENSDHFPALRISGNGSSVDFLQGDALQSMLEQAKLIISRSGYSTLMDLAALKAKAILIPTPGQTEQEYLAGQVVKKKIAYTVSQDKFDLTSAISHSSEYVGFINFPEPNSLLEAAVKKILNEKIH